MTTKVENVRKVFGDFEALKSVSVSIEEGEFIAILGPSGCGKTTLLRLIAGFEEPTAGSIYIDNNLVGNENHVKPPELRNIGMVFQSFALWPHMKIYDQVEFPIIHHSSTPDRIKSNRKKRMETVLKLVGLSDLSERRPNELSGGQKQRVALARAIAHEPSLLLMDEPLSSLDAELREEMRKEIQILHRKTKSTILYVTHDQGEALAMADRMVIMKDGAIEQIGTPEDIYLRPNTSFVASFVSKAILIPGSWEGSVFYPDAAPDNEWDGKCIASAFKENGTYPVRPDEWIMSKKFSGIQVVINNALYQGREIHYSATDQTGLTVNMITPISERYEIGDKVSIQKTGTKVVSVTSTTAR
ncbi:transporter [Salipaludibacillus neizhouensis]|uniref:Transporter n=1 Tax=Salipaludibacillus neizhouensis TaxID=885475 RepID=A0A3A9K959_9BACI|nr:ABC transporter ATP-binding protein [Salipaludibacillus neizhouensis]RKL67350.1 transporter [Salipaludibacillus neizhouensis]